MENVIEVKELVRQYVSASGIVKKSTRTITAVNNISFNVKRGEIFGLLGPNGAGKTTTIKILTTLLAPTSGEARVLGYRTFGEEKKLRPYINFIFGGERGLYWRLSARENLTYFADLYKVDKSTMKKRIPELLKLVGLEDRADEKVESYSKGMKQRVQIARGLINDPEVIFLDEPTIGLDPVGAKDLRKIVSLLSEQGKTILLTTHYMYEADELCNRIAIINKGEIMALDTPEKLKELSIGMSVIEIKAYNVSDNIMNSIRRINGIAKVNVKEQEQIQMIQMQCKNPYDLTSKVLDTMKGCKVLGINTREASLEDAYINIVGESA